MSDAASQPPGSAYIRSVQVGGLLILLGSSVDIWMHPPGWAWVLLTGVAALTGSYAVKIPGVVVRLSLSEPIVFLSTLLFGPTPGTITAAVDALVMSLRLPSRLRTPHRILFNVGGLAISVLPSALLYFLLAGLDPRAPAYGGLGTFVIPLYLFAVSVFAINSTLVAMAVSIERRLSAFFVWKTQFLWLSASYLASAAIAAILVVLTNSVDYALAGVLLPLIVVSFLAVRTSLGRLDDTNKHLTEVNTLYLSTIETLAMAIDAKDQVTHGHIRRVQRFAVGLAKALGVTEERQLRAIEAAALLHDMGKLAIPEFILNKPGKLTAREFSVMKTHAAVGADLLSSIQFPYPVVPIVRHHHENWDGSGYPDGIRGSDIPVGARILSVVDCYDALTSDRPYRRAMSSVDALEILAQRRGRMYDPLVVDTFIREHASLCAAAEIRDLPDVILVNHSETGASPQGAPDPPGPHAAPIESLRLLSSLSPLQDGPPLRVLCRHLVDDLRGIATFDTAALYVLDDTSSEATAIYAHGSAGRFLQGTRIPIAERLTGWVAAHRTAVWNSDAALDLNTTAAAAALSLGSSLPLCTGDTLVGVLSLYGRSDQEITVGQRRALESLLPTLATSLGAALLRPGAAIDCTDADTRAAALSALDAMLSHDRRVGAAQQGAVLAITLLAPQSDNGRSPHLDLAAAELSTRLSPQNSLSRCVLVLSATQLLLCALDDATLEQLEREVVSASHTRSLQPFTISTSPIESPLDLQERVRVVLDGAPASTQDGRTSRIH